MQCTLPAFLHAILNMHFTHKILNKKVRGGLSMRVVVLAMHTVFQETFFQPIETEYMPPYNRYRPSFFSIFYAIFFMICKVHCTVGVSCYLAEYVVHVAGENIHLWN